MFNTIKLKAKFRLLFGFCPSCNSDAPEKDNCKICNNFYGVPSKELKKEWLIKYMDKIKKCVSCNKNEAEVAYLFCKECIIKANKK